jgi:hypothetical protein
MHPMLVKRTRSQIWFLGVQITIWVFWPKIWRWKGSTIVDKKMINKMKLIVRLHGKVLENVGQTLKDKNWCMERETNVYWIWIKGFFLSLFFGV